MSSCLVCTRIQSLNTCTWIQAAVLQSLQYWKATHSLLILSERCMGNLDNCPALYDKAIPVPAPYLHEDWSPTAFLLPELQTCSSSTSSLGCFSFWQDRIWTTSVVVSGLEHSANINLQLLVAAFAQGALGPACSGCDTLTQIPASEQLHCQKVISSEEPEQEAKPDSDERDQAAGHSSCSSTSALQQEDLSQLHLWVTYNSSSWTRERRGGNPTG